MTHLATSAGRLPAKPGSLPLVIGATAVGLSLLAGLSGHGLSTGTLAQDLAVSLGAAAVVTLGCMALKRQKGSLLPLGMGMLAFLCCAYVTQATMAQRQLQDPPRFASGFLGAVTGLTQERHAQLVAQARYQAEVQAKRLSEDLDEYMQKRGLPPLISMERIAQAPQREQLMKDLQDSQQEILRLLGQWPVRTAELRAQLASQDIPQDWQADVTKAFDEGVAAHTEPLKRRMAVLDLMLADAGRCVALLHQRPQAWQIEYGRVMFSQASTLEQFRAYQQSLLQLGAQLKVMP